MFHYVRNLLILYYKKIEDLKEYVKIFKLLPLEKIFKYLSE